MIDLDGTLPRELEVMISRPFLKQNTVSSPLAVIQGIQFPKYAYCWGQQVTASSKCVSHELGDSVIAYPRWSFDRRGRGPPWNSLDTWSRCDCDASLAQCGERGVDHAANPPAGTRLKPRSEQ